MQSGSVVYVSRWLGVATLVSIVACRRSVPQTKDAARPQEVQDAGVARSPVPSLKLVDRTISSEVMTRGREVYESSCAQCHGVNGDGAGPAATMTPRPRDFRKGTIKFASVPAGGLPTDDDLDRTIRNGLAGTSMNAVSLTPENRSAVIQYLKSFSPRWKTEHVPEAIRTEPDPWKPGDPAAIARGREIYHSVTLCWNCHPTYASRDEITAWTRARMGDASPLFRENLESGTTLVNDFGDAVTAPDFAKTPLKSGRSLEAVFRVIAAGVGGTPMPSWQDSLPAEDLWALAHFVWMIVDEGKGFPAS